MTEHPTFSGLLVHHDPAFGYSVLVPDGWQRMDLSGSASGVFYVPDAGDLLTGLAIDAVDLGTRVRPTDLAHFERGLTDGLGGLTDCRIEHQEADVVGELITLEARCTFSEQGASRKRWVRLLYQGRTQVRLVAQAASVELFEYWEPMFFEAMRTVRFGSVPY